MTVVMAVVVGVVTRFSGCGCDHPIVVHHC
jgi:hypothetical protein